MTRARRLPWIVVLSATGVGAVIALLVLRRRRQLTDWTEDLVADG